MSKEIVELYCEGLLTMLNDDDQVKPSFSNFDLLDSSQRSGRNPKIGEPHYCPMRANPLPKSITQGANRKICWNQTITLNYI